MSTEANGLPPRAALTTLWARTARALRRTARPTGAGRPRTALAALRAQATRALGRTADTRAAGLPTRTTPAAMRTRAAGAPHRTARPTGAGSAEGPRSHRTDRADAPPQNLAAAGAQGTGPPPRAARDALRTRAARALRRTARPHDTHGGEGHVIRRAPAPHRRAALHAGAWWVWALGLGTAASRTTNPLLLGLIVAVAGYVVAVRRTDAPWARSYAAFLKLGLVVLAIRLLFALLFGSPIPSTRVLFTLPEVPLPDWAQGVRIGGRVTAEGLVFALYEGLKLATLLVCVGAANALASPARLLKSLPGALYEAGVAVVVAMTFAPHLVADVRRLRAARRLRGRPDRGVKALLQVGLPVLEGALERSVALAAAMDARGYGRAAQVPPAVRRTTGALTLGGLLGVCCGTYGLLSSEGAAYGLPLLLAGLAAALGGLWLGGRRSVRSRYRPDRWGVRAWLVSGSGAAVAALMIWAASYAPESLTPPAVPLTAPDLPLWPAAGVLLGLLPALVAPAPARPVSYATEEATQ